MSYRECPKWFQSALTHLGGTNPYGEPIFSLVWGEYATHTVGGIFPDGREGYRDALVVNDSCWAILMWEPAEVMGTPRQWERDFRDEQSGYLDIGGYPHYGRYRLLQKLIHREMVNGEMVTTRLEPSSFILDIMAPMILMWQRTSDELKLKLTQQKVEKAESDYLKLLKDSRSAVRVRRGSALVQKRVEELERGMKLAMKIAAQTRLGMRQIA